MNKKYIVGIDLGTSNTVVAYAAPGRQQVELFEIEQLVGPGQVAARPLLPSVRYHPAAGEIDAGELQLPWPVEETEAPVVAGRLALDLGGQVPGRLVASAKSWLSHAAVDRLAPILPWGADDTVSKVSPVAASASYLAHVRAAWLHRFPQAPLERQQLVLTVPASFDEGARALTLAAEVAGLDLLVLDAPELYDREGSPYLDATGNDWPDNDLRFAALCKAAALVAGGAVKGWRRDQTHRPSRAHGLSREVPDVGARRPGRLAAVGRDQDAVLRTRRGLPAHDQRGRSDAGRSVAGARHGRLSPTPSPCRLQACCPSLNDRATSNAVFGILKGLAAGEATVTLRLLPSLRTIINGR